jgi:hypothetical protein
MTFVVGVKVCHSWRSTLQPLVVKKTICVIDSARPKNDYHIRSFIYFHSNGQFFAGLDFLSFGTTKFRDYGIVENWEFVRKLFADVESILNASLTTLKKWRKTLKEEKLHRKEEEQHQKKQARSNDSDFGVDESTHHTDVERSKLVKLAEETKKKVKKTHFVVVIFNQSKTPPYTFLTSENTSTDVDENKRRTEVTRLIHSLVNERLIPFIKSHRSLIEKEIFQQKVHHATVSFVMDGKAEPSTGTAPHSEVYFAETGALLNYFKLGHAWGEDRNLYWIRHSSKVAHCAIHHIAEILKQEKYLESKANKDPKWHGDDSDSDSDSDSAIEFSNSQESHHLLNKNSNVTFGVRIDPSNQHDLWNTTFNIFTCCIEKKIFKMNVRSCSSKTDKTKIERDLLAIKNIFLQSLQLESVDLTSIYFEYEIPLHFIIPNHHIISDIHVRYVGSDNTVTWEYRIEVDDGKLNIVPILTKLQYLFDIFYAKCLEPQWRVSSDWRPSKLLYSKDCPQLQIFINCLGSEVVDLKERLCIPRVYDMYNEWEKLILEIYTNRDKSLDPQEEDFDDVSI